MARFVVDINTDEFNPLADKTATLLEALEKKCGYEICTVYGILDNNACQFDDPPHAVERLINQFRLLHDCVIAPPESAVKPKIFRKPGEPAPEGSVEAAQAALAQQQSIDVPVESKPKPKRRTRATKKKQKEAATDAEVVS